MPGGPFLKKTGRTPVAIGSRVPEWPTLLTRVRFLILATTSNDVQPLGLLTMIMPSILHQIFERPHVLYDFANDPLFNLGELAGDDRAGGLEVAAAAEAPRDLRNVDPLLGAEIDLDLLFFFAEENGDLDPFDGADRVNNADQVFRPGVRRRHHLFGDGGPGDLAVFGKLYVRERLGRDAHAGDGLCVVNARRQLRRVDAGLDQLRRDQEGLRVRVVIAEIAGVGDDRSVEAVGHRLVQLDLQEFGQVVDQLADAGGAPDAIDIAELGIIGMMVDIDDPRGDLSQLDLIPDARDVGGVNDKADVKVMEVGHRPLDLLRAGEKTIDPGDRIGGVIMGFQLEMLEDHAKGEHGTDGVAIRVDMRGYDRRSSAFEGVFYFPARVFHALTC